MGWQGCGCEMTDRMSSLEHSSCTSVGGVDSLAEAAVHCCTALRWQYTHKRPKIETVSTHVLPMQCVVTCFIYTPHQSKPMKIKAITVGETQDTKSKSIKKNLQQIWWKSEKHKDSRGTLRIHMLFDRSQCCRNPKTSLLSQDSSFSMR